MNAKTLQKLHELFGKTKFRIQRSMESVTYVLEPIGIGHLIFHNSRFDSKFINQLDKLVDMVIYDAKFEKIRLLLIFNIEKDFCSGLNLKEVYTIVRPEQAELFCKKRQAITSKIFTLSIPTTCYLSGMCFGFGYEIALSCNKIVSLDHKKSMISCPQVKYGLIPCGGGSWSISRRVGLAKALEILLMAKLYPVHKALEYGMIDHVIKNDEDYFKNLREYVVKYSFIPTTKQITWTEYLLESNCIGRYIMENTIRSTLSSLNIQGYQIPYEMVRIVIDCFTLPKKEAYSLERKCFVKVNCAQESKNMLVQYFNMNEHAKIFKNVETKVNKIRMVSALGRSATKRPKYYFSLDNLNSVTDLKSCDVFFEYFSDFEVKKKTLSWVNGKFPGIIYVSCNEHISVTNLAVNSPFPDKIIGMSFFHPFNKLMPLVEIIKTVWTSDQTVLAIYKFVLSIGKIPIIVKDSTGFLTTRLFAIFCVEAANMVFEGVSLAKIDKLLQQFGMGLGPFEIMDEVGLDVVLACLPTLTSTLGKRFSECESGIRELVTNGYVGKKTQGLYIYDQEIKRINPKVLEILAKYEEEKKPLPSDADIVDRCILLLINEATLCLMEDIVAYPEDIDLAIVFGLAFPAYRGGLLQYCDDLNRQNILIPRLKELENKYGSKFHPTTLLKNMAVLGQSFYPERIIIHNKKSKL
jgi:3-hydroxyacyl-CoA dehydrogenase/enoyl-CoA hydratase/3-hydroxybutyryl-CoA epimerase